MLSGEIDVLGNAVDPDGLGTASPAGAAWTGGDVERPHLGRWTGRQLLGRRSWGSAAWAGVPWAGGEWVARSWRGDGGRGAGALSSVLGWPQLLAGPLVALRADRPEHDRRSQDSTAGIHQRYHLAAHEALAGSRR